MRNKIPWKFNLIISSYGVKQLEIDISLDKLNIWNFGKLEYIIIFLVRRIHCIRKKEKISNHSYLEWKLKFHESLVW